MIVREKQCCRVFPILSGLSQQDDSRDVLAPQHIARLRDTTLSYHHHDDDDHDEEEEAGT